MKKEETACQASGPPQCEAKNNTTTQHECEWQQVGRMRKGGSKKEMHRLADRAFFKWQTLKSMTLQIERNSLCGCITLTGCYSSSINSFGPLDVFMRVPCYCNGVVFICYHIINHTITPLWSTLQKKFRFLGTLLSWIGNCEDIYLAGKRNIHPTEICVIELLYKLV